MNDEMREIIIDAQIVNPYMKKWKYTCGKEHGIVYGCMIYSGIFLWKNDFHMRQIPHEFTEDYSYLMLNYCFKGRCEVALEHNRYVYLETGILSIDRNQPAHKFVSPNGRYEGIEIILNMEILKKHTPQMFQDCGIHLEELYEKLNDSGGSILAAVSKEWQDKAGMIAALFEKGGVNMEEYRFEVLGLLYLLFHGHMKSANELSYLTRGQKTIAMEVESRLISNFKVPYTIESLAQEYGISASSLEKYFAGVYGTSIAKYIRDKKMEKAMELLMTTKSTIADIAAEAGYSNQSKFGSVFKRYAGVTPLEYRRLQSSDCGE